jgi:sporulation protein YlmC with PRC-barrel domain
MFWRMLMTTVAVLALAVPAAAQQKAPQQPLPPGQAAGQQEQQAAPAAEGQPADQKPPTAAQQQPLEEPAEAEVAVTPPADMKFLEVQDETQFLADEEVIGKDVVNVMDEEVGTIADLVVDQEKKLVGVVLSVGGFLGVGDKWVAVSVDQIDFPTDEQPARLLVAVTEEQLKNAPDFMTREAVEAEKAAEQAQQQQQQVPPPATTGQ